MNVRNLIRWRQHRSSERNLGTQTAPFLALHRDMNRRFDEFLRDMDGRTGYAWPQIEVSETDEEVKVVAELAGLEERDVNMTLDEGVLTLKGQKRLERSSTVYSERWEGAFERVIPVGQDVDPDKVKASFKNGVLAIRLPKKPEAQRQAKRIKVR